MAKRPIPSRVPFRVPNRGLSQTFTEIAPSGRAVGLAVERDRTILTDLGPEFGLDWSETTS